MLSCSDIVLDIINNCSKCLPYCIKSVHTASSVLHCLLNHTPLSEKWCLWMLSAYKNTRNEGFSFYPAALMPVHFPRPSAKQAGRSQIASECWLHPQAKTMCTGDFCEPLLLIWFLPTQNPAQGSSLNRWSHIMSFHLRTGVLSDSFSGTSQVFEVAPRQESDFISVTRLQSGCVSPWGGTQMNRYQKTGRKYIHSFI